jgi:hypothetical protein
VRWSRSEKRKVAWKLKASEWEIPDEAMPTTRINQISGEDATMDQSVVINDVGAMEDGPAEDTDGDLLMQDVVERWTLNREQRRAFEIVAQHTMGDKPEQLLMYLGGPGGTGKSRVINALRDFFGSRNETRRFRLAAYTGVAARNIGGATLHAVHVGWG